MIRKVAILAVISVGVASTRAGAQERFEATTRAACRSDPAGPAFLSRDSAGIRIVENNPGALAQVPRFGIDSQPTLRLGEHQNDTAHTFTGVVFDADRLSDGSVVVVDGWPRTRVRLFNREGRFVRQISTSQPGNGSHGQLVTIHVRAGDTLLLVDEISRQVHFYLPGGEFLRTTPLSPPGRNSDSVTKVVGSLANGDLLGLQSKSEPTDSATRKALGLPPLGTDTLFVYTMAPHGTGWTRVAGPLAGEQMYHWSNVYPFLRRQGFAPTPNGFWHSDSREYSISRYGADGKLVQITRLCREPKPVTADDIRQHPQHEPIKVAIPTLWPAHLSIRVDAMQRLWVQEPVAGEHLHWLIYLPDGRLEMQVLMPSMFFQAGSDFVLRGLSNASDERILQFHRLVPRRER